MKLPGPVRFPNLREVIELAADVREYRAMREFKILRATPARVLVDRWHQSNIDAGVDAIALLVRYRTLCEAFVAADDFEHIHLEALKDSLAVDVAEELIRHVYPEEDSPVTEPVIPEAAPVEPDGSPIPAAAP